MLLGISDKEQKPFCDMRISEKVFKKAVFVQENLVLCNSEKHNKII